MASRPYLGSGIAELEKLFGESAEDQAILKALCKELSFRNTDRAKTLLTRVVAAQEAAHNTTEEATGTAGPLFSTANVVRPSSWARAKIIDRTATTKPTGSVEVKSSMAQSAVCEAPARATPTPVFADPEHARLAGLYAELRNKLLDLTLRNPMLSYRPLAKSRKQLQIIDEAPEDAFARLTSGNAKLDIVALPEPDDIPADERTEEFGSQLAYLRTTDVEYLAKLEGLASLGRDDEFEIAKLDRWLRDKVRTNLGLPSRPNRKQLDLAAHAREHGVNPALELEGGGQRSGTRAKKLQTLLLPESLEARMEAIQDLARLSKQEMGLSTLFLAFGFLEWYQTDDSDKASFAPLLLVPVNLEERVVLGKKVFSISASADVPDVNITLAKYLEEKHSRELPKFDDDEDRKDPIEGYFEAVRHAVDGLKRWKVRRFLTLGHFAFGRLVMYQDLDPAGWPTHPAMQGIVGSVLRGTEAPVEQDRDALSSVPPDYPIDEPEIEKLAPFLMHDADASQHSAIVDVMKGENLVIEGPPGTGKSQTITNIIANALARDQNTTILFLSEKLAALQVVKRRLDKAGLGEFCLELHSEKSSPKGVIESLMERVGAKARSASGTGILNRQSWDETRGEISSYLDALHTTDEDGETAFALFWKSIAGDRANTGTPTRLLYSQMPEALLSDPERQRYLLNEVQVFGCVAQAYMDLFGAPSGSPWAKVRPTAERFRASELLTVCEDLRDAAEKAASILTQAEPFGISGLRDLERLASAMDSVPAPPAMDGIERVRGLDARAAQIALDLKARLIELDRDLGADPLTVVIDDTGFELAKRLAAALEDPSQSGRTPKAIFEAAEADYRTNSALGSRLAAVVPILDRLRLGQGELVEILPAACLATVAASALPEAQRNWLAWKPVDRIRFQDVERRWEALSEADRGWASNLPGYDPALRPKPEQLKDAAEILSDALAKITPWKRERWKQARDLAAQLGATESPSDAADVLRALSRHVAEVEAFEADKDGAAATGPLWRGLATEFAGMIQALKCQDMIGTRLASLPLGDRVASALFALDGDSLSQLASHVEAAKAAHEVDSLNLVAGLPITEALVGIAALQGAARKILEADPDRILAKIDAPLDDILAHSRLRAERERLEREFKANHAGTAIEALVRTKGDVSRLGTLLDWCGTVRDAGLAESVSGRLLTATGAEAHAALLGVARSARDVVPLFVGARLRLAQEFGVTLDGEPDALGRAADELLAHRAGLPDYLEQAQIRRALDDAGLADFLRAADEEGIAASQLADLLGYVLMRKRAERALHKQTVLRSMTGNRLNARRNLFATQDRLKIEKDRADVRSRLLARRPDPGMAYGPKKTWTEMALLRNELSKSQRFINVRALLRQAPNSIRALKPCFMMSPLSVAKFLPKGMTFDLVVIDEASQMRPEDGLGALLRAKQIVVVGDPKQLPPSDFFNRSSDTQDVADEEVDDALNDESILEACSKAFNKVRHLKWHYRSRCESLIAFSNREFYKTLVTFPMARPGSFSIDRVRVDGVFEAKQNAAEAQRICEEAILLMHRLADAPESEFGTIGIVAVNSDQRDRIQEELRRLSSGDEVVERFRERSEASGEPLFVKNLENVQGDERDYILISLTYGRHPGKTAVLQTFGPINRSQGHRRLNVLFSRARRRIGLFTSMDSGDIKPTETSKRGVHVLRAYLEYVERQGGASGDVTGLPFDSPFEAEVAERLAEKGYEVDVQVGVSGFRIDLGIRHPDRPSVYLAGIECDGAAYHSSKSARDRDRLREEVLRELGWNILRVWSTDWFADPRSETEKLVAALKKLEAKPLHTPESEIVFGSGSEGAQPASDVVFGDSLDAAPQEEPSVHESRSDPIVVPPTSYLSGTGHLSEREARLALEEFRRTVIDQEMPDAERHRSILRDAMIEHFVGTRFTEPEKWFERIPTHLRQGCDPAQKRYLEPICEIVSRVH